MTKKSDDRFNPARLYDRYRVKIAVRDRICGGMPRNKELIRAWVESTTEFSDEKSEALIQENAELVVNAVAEKCWNGFPEDENGLFVPTRNVKAMLKQSAQLLGIYGKKRGSKQILAEGMEVKSLGARADRVHLGKLLPEPDLAEDPDRQGVLRARGEERHDHLVEGERECEQGAREERGPELREGHVAKGLPWGGPISAGWYQSSLKFFHYLVGRGLPGTNPVVTADRDAKPVAPVTVATIERPVCSRTSSTSSSTP